MVFINACLNYLFYFFCLWCLVLKYIFVITLEKSNKNIILICLFFPLFIKHLIQAVMSNPIELPQN